jgi:hypothetical protein
LQTAERITVPITKWNTKLATFQLCVPKAEPVSQSQLDSSYDKSFENLFNASAKDDDWADVVVEKQVPATPTAGAAFSSSSGPSVARLPVLDALSRPPELFKTTGPYILIVEERVPNIVIQCSHEPSLELIAAYLNKWGKSNPNDSLKVSLTVFV